MKKLKKCCWTCGHLGVSEAGKNGEVYVYCDINGKPINEPFNKNVCYKYTVEEELKESILKQKHPVLPFEFENWKLKLSPDKEDLIITNEILPNEKVWIKLWKNSVGWFKIETSAYKGEMYPKDPIIKHKE